MSDNELLARTKIGEFFRPRRLGHANIFIGDYERAQEFYYSVVGFHEAYRQPDNMASFVSNGNTYHDFGLTDIRSKYAPKGQKPGLFHIAFELETEVDLVDGYNRAKKAGVAFSHTRDHDVAHSLYLYDPDGNMLEIYADVIHDWRSNRHGIIIKKKPDYIPGVTSVPLAEPQYPLDPEIIFVPDSIFKSIRVTHVGMVAKDFPAMFRYYTEIVGLSPLVGSAEAPYAVLRGTYGTGEITLYRPGPGLEPGLHHVGILVTGEDNLDHALTALPAAGIAIVRHVEHPARRAITIQDPDGINLEFYVDRDWRKEMIATVGEDDAPYLL